MEREREGEKKSEPQPPLDQWVRSAMHHNNQTSALWLWALNRVQHHQAGHLPDDEEE